jgi:hypothetical protein
MTPVQVLHMVMIGSPSCSALAKVLALIGSVMFGANRSGTTYNFQLVEFDAQFVSDLTAMGKAPAASTETQPDERVFIFLPLSFQKNSLDLVMSGR